MERLSGKAAFRSSPPPLNPGNFPRWARLPAWSKPATHTVPTAKGRGSRQTLWEHPLRIRQSTPPMTGMVFTILVHQDPGPFWKGTRTTRVRPPYASSRVLITRGDIGKQQQWQAAAELSPGSHESPAAGLSNFYCPASGRDGAALTLRNTDLGVLPGRSSISPGVLLPGNDTRRPKERRAGRESCYCRTAGSRPGLHLEAGTSRPDHPSLQLFRHVSLSRFVTREPLCPPSHASNAVRANSPALAPRERQTCPLNRL